MGWFDTNTIDRGCHTIITSRSMSNFRAFNSAPHIAICTDACLDTFQPAGVFSMNCRKPVMPFPSELSWPWLSSMNTVDLSSGNNVSINCGSKVSDKQSCLWLKSRVTLWKGKLSGKCDWSIVHRFFGCFLNYTIIFTVTFKWFSIGTQANLQSNDRKNVISNRPEWHMPIINWCILWR